MIEEYYYKSPIGTILLSSRENQLIGLYFLKENAFHADSIYQGKIAPVLEQTTKWLDAYFKGENPDFRDISFQLEGTSFEKQVWDLLLEIPYGETVTYQFLAEKVAKLRGVSRMSPQAVGQAVSKNPISILVPCHRVVGKNWNLTGYRGGMDKKVFLLKREGVDIKKFTWREGKMRDGEN